MNHKMFQFWTTVKDLAQGESICDSVTVNVNYHTSLDWELLWKHASLHVYESVPRKIHLRREDPAQWGWHHPTVCIPELNEKEKVSEAPAFSFLCPLTEGCNWGVSPTAAAPPPTVMGCDLKRWAKYILLSSSCSCQIICHHTKSKGCNTLLSLGVINTEHFVTICDDVVCWETSCLLENVNYHIWKTWSNISEL